LRKVQHLRRCIWAELEKPDDARCLHQLQPTAAVAGLPRRAALDLSPVMNFLPAAGMPAPPAICRWRKAILRGSAFGESRTRTLRLYAGAGIVSGSDPEQEWQEIENKAAGLRSLLLSEV
jgi:menaquinone-specific isochorismate synthase